MTAADLWAEFNTARRAMQPPDRALLEIFGIAPGDIALLCGITHARVSGGLYEPDYDGGEAFITPVLIDHPIGPETISPSQTVRFGEICDLVIWHPRRPDVWALRVGGAEWLGNIPPQYMDPPPVPIRRSVLSWFQYRCSGLVLLSSEPADQYRILSGCHGGIIAENAAHEAELLRILERPWPHPPVLLRDSGRHRNAA